MFAQVPSETGTPTAAAALLGGHAMIPAPTPPAKDTTGKTVEPSEPEKVRGMVKNQDFVVWSLVFAGLLLIAAVVFMLFDRWRKRPAGESARDTSMSLSSFREMYENGELTETEYQRIRDRMAAKLKEKVGAPPAPPTKAATTPPPDAPPTPPPE